MTRWANQGILLLNCALTLPMKSQAGSHIKLWEPFIKEVLLQINKQKDSIVFGMMGAEARKYAGLLSNETFALYTCDHPSRANYMGGKWKHENIFKSISGFHKFKNNIEIKW